MQVTLVESLISHDLRAGSEILSRIFLYVPAQNSVSRFD